MSTTTNARRVGANGDRSRRDRLALERYHRSGGLRERDELVARFMPLASTLARRYSRGPESLDDLTQVAAFGLVKAIERYDPSRGVPFGAYAVPTIAGELKRHLRDYSWAVRPPRYLLERTLVVGRAIDQFGAEHGRMPTVTDLTQRIAGLDEADVLEALQARRAATATSLQTPQRGADGEQTLGDSIGSDDRDYARVEQRMLLDSLLSGLGAREREVMRMRVCDDMTQAEIGRVIGVSQMQVSRIVRRAIERMHDVAEEHPRRAA